MKKILFFTIFSFFVLISPLSLADDIEITIKGGIGIHFEVANHSKKLVHIEGNCGSYGFGSFVHIGKIWWCPNFPIYFGFSPENLYTFEINGIPQEINNDNEGLQINIENFFGIAPTLIDFVFLPPRNIFVYGICDEIIVHEFK